MPKLPLTFACGLYDRMLALYTGDVKVEGVDLNFLVEDDPRVIFDRMDELGDLLAGRNIPHAAQRAGARHIDLLDPGVRMRRAEDRGKAQARQRRQVVDEARPPGEQRLILLARSSRPDPRLGFRPGQFSRTRLQLTLLT